MNSAALLLATTLPLLGATPPLLEKIEDFRDSQTTWEARFTQVSMPTGFGLGEEVEHGNVYLKIPGKMRWEYEEPERKLFVTDGVSIYSYYPEDAQVRVSRVDPEDDSLLAAFLLSGKSTIEDRFRVEEPHAAEATQPGCGIIRLIPKSETADVQYLLIEAEFDTGAIKRLVVVDSLDNRTEWLFTRIQARETLPDSLFRFEIPDNVDVIR